MGMAMGAVVVQLPVRVIVFLTVVKVQAAFAAAVVAKKIPAIINDKTIFFRNMVFSFPTEIKKTADEGPAVLSKE